MTLIFETIGQRDVQIFVKDKDFQFDSLHKSKLHEGQNIIKKMLLEERVRWSPAIGLEGKGDIMNIDTDEITICFPLLERVLSQLNQQNGYKFYLFYTDRQHFEIDKDYIMNEPWLFNQLIKYFWSDLINYYQLDLPLIMINLCEDMTQKLDINMEFAFSQLDKIIAGIYYENEDKISLEVYNSAGMPIISQAMNTIAFSYFHKNVSFFDVTPKIINPNKQQQVLKKYALKFTLLQNLKNYNFFEARNNALEIKMNKSQPDLYLLIESAYLWFNHRSKAMKKLETILNKKNISTEIRDIVKPMYEMISKKQGNEISCNILRLLQEYRLENFLSLATLFISTVELFVIKYLNHNFPGLICTELIYDKQRKMIDVDALPFSIPGINLGSKIDTSWKNYHLVIEEGVNNKVEKMEILNELSNNISNLKNARNYFIHEGTPIEKKSINIALKIDTQMKSNEENANSKTIKLLIEEVNKLQSEYYFNWVTLLRNYLLKKVIEYSVLFEEN